MSAGRTAASDFVAAAPASAAQPAPMNSLLVCICFMVSTFSFFKLNTGPAACPRTHLAR